MNWWISCDNAPPGPAVACLQNDDWYFPATLHSSFCLQLFQLYMDHNPPILLLIWSNTFSSMDGLVCLLTHTGKEVILKPNSDLQLITVVVKTRLGLIIILLWTTLARRKVWTPEKPEPLCFFFSGLESGVSSVFIGSTSPMASKQVQSVRALADWCNRCGGRLFPKSAISA